MIAFVECLHHIGVIRIYLASAQQFTTISSLHTARLVVVDLFDMNPERAYALYCRIKYFSENIQFTNGPVVLDVIHYRRI